MWAVRVGCGMGLWRALDCARDSLTYKCPLQNTQNWPADSREVFWAQAIAQTNADFGILSFARL